MSERNSSRQHSRRKYLAAVGAAGVAAVGSTGVIAGLLGQLGAEAITRIGWVKRSRAI
jgi:hypothetical protein